MLIPVILSGGAGTRLWPVSRRAEPKPFLRLPDGESLLYKTLDRALAVADSGMVLTVTSRELGFRSRDEYRSHPQAADVALPLLLEPMGRNTAPAAILAALNLQARCGDDALMLLLPADHLVQDLDAFRVAVAHAAKLAAKGWLTTFGIRPTHAETGFGYIEMGNELGEDGSEVAAFIEKPDLARAEAFLASGRFLWNSGMFCFRVGSLLEAAHTVAPDLLTAARAAHAAATDNGVDIAFEPVSFAAMPDISIDYAIMERAKHRAVVPASFGWSDIGSWNAVGELSAADADGNRVQGQTILVEARGCIVQGAGRMVALVGTEDLVVVDTGDAVLVAHRSQTQSVKAVVERLRAENHQSASVHRTAHRPWGSYTVLEDADDCKVKRLTVKPGGILSLQRHQRRSEHWTVVQGTAKVRVGEEEFLLERNQSTFIPMGTLHRLENPGTETLHLIETQCGDYFGEDDIERLEDVYGRA
jgi:mannose-1-phosphate guanylyltransferase / mannose-6-phosphate isomerase